MHGEIVVYLVGTDTFVRWMDKSQAICYTLAYTHTHIIYTHTHRSIHNVFKTRCIVYGHALTPLCSSYCKAMVFVCVRMRMI